jgi:Flp pilus assembly protein TadG
MIKEHITLKEEKNARTSISNNICTREGGAVALEYALLIPFMLFITFGIIQLALLYIANSVMDYAAFSAARAALVTDINTRGDADQNTDPEKAAKMITSLISFGEDPANERIHIPGWGKLKGSAYSQKNTEVVLEEDGRSMKATVNFKYHLVFPQISLPFLRLGAMDFSNSDDGKEIILSKSHSLYRSF